MWICKYCETENQDQALVCACCGRERNPLAQGISNYWGKNNGTTSTAPEPLAEPPAKPVPSGKRLWIAAAFCVIAVCLLLFKLTVRDRAEYIDSGTCGENVSWKLDTDGKLIISGKGRMADYYIGEAPWADYLDAIREIVITNGVSYIGTYAFDRSAAETLVIPKSVTEIGESAFVFCLKLETLTIPEGVTKIGRGAFANCEALQGVKLADSISEIDDGAFYMCKALKDVLLPKNLKCLKFGVFNSCRSLEYIEVPRCVESIEDFAFAYCTSLKTVSINNDAVVFSGTPFIGCEWAKISFWGSDRQAMIDEDGRVISERYSDIDIGDTILFGTYEQDNNSFNGKENIEWIVVAKEDNKLLVISDKALDCKQYNTSYADVTWEGSSLRKWINGTFLNVAFSAEEQAQIQNTSVSADKNPKYSTNPGNATTDKVFLLSITEAEKYFTTDESRKCAPTAYAEAQGAYTSDSNKTAFSETTCSWWMRSPGSYQNWAAFVYNDGSIYCSGDYVLTNLVCVRPALWLNLK